MQCDCCKRELKPDERVYDVAVMACGTDPQAEDWDPQSEGYLCVDCFLLIPLNIRKALT